MPFSHRSSKASISASGHGVGKHLFAGRTARVKLALEKVYSKVVGGNKIAPCVFENSSRTLYMEGRAGTCLLHGLTKKGD